jgi:hypothetical protein
MLSCEEVTELCSQELERDLLLQERLPLRMHLLMCSGCSNFRKQMSLMRVAMRRYASGDAVSTSNEPPTEP